MPKEIVLGGTRVQLDSPDFIAGMNRDLGREICKHDKEWTRSIEFLERTCVMSKTDKVPKRIHCTFDHAEIGSEPGSVAIYANADQYNIRMIVWSTQVEALKAFLEQIQNGAISAKSFDVVWKPVVVTGE